MRTRIILFILFLNLIFILGCKKFVQIDPPATQLVTASVFDNNNAATAAQVAIYTAMVTNLESVNMATQTGLLCDELTTYNRDATYLQYYRNAMIATNNPGPWLDVYNYIYQANAILTAVQGTASLNPSVARQLLGESKFIRAFWFFYLTNLYGDIPLVVSPDYTKNQSIARTSKSLVYQQIIADLIDAKILMNTNYIDVSDTTVTTSDRTRPNKWAAAALLSRVYLYTGDNASAETEADSLIGNALYSLNPDPNSVFLVNSSEAIWQLDIPEPSNYNTPDGEYFILTAEPGSSVSCCAIAPQLLSSFEAGDLRRVDWIDSFSTADSPPITYYFPYKYKVNAGGPPVTEDIMVLRLAEQYLIRAEARTNQADLSGGASDLNVIRNRAGLANISDSVAASQAALLSAILHERKVEFFTEWGHRWLDLVRTGSADSVMSVVTPSKGGTWSTDGHQLLYPIPAKDRARDVNLSQNPGY
jgi:hypothetical protein